MNDRLAVVSAAKDEPGIAFVGQSAIRDNAHPALDQRAFDAIKFR
jgi:hypothetical protein